MSKICPDYCFSGHRTSGLGIVRILSRKGNFQTNFAIVHRLFQQFPVPVPLNRLIGALKDNCQDKFWTHMVLDWIYWLREGKASQLAWWVPVRSCCPPYSRNLYQKCTNWVHCKRRGFLTELFPKDLHQKTNSKTPRPRALGKNHSRNLQEANPMGKIYKLLYPHLLQRCPKVLPQRRAEGLSGENANIGGERRVSREPVNKTS